MASRPDLAAYSGLRKVVDFTPTTGQGFADAVRDAMLTAGWSQEATIPDAFGTGYKMLSQESPWIPDDEAEPAAYNNKIKVHIRLLDSGVRIGLQGSNEAETMIQAVANRVVFPAPAGRPTRINVNAFQFLLYVPGSPANDNACLGTALNLPPQMQRTTQGNCREALYLGQINTLRTDLSMGAASQQWRGINIGGTLHEYSGDASSIARLMLMATVSAGTVTGGTQNPVGTLVWNKTGDPTMTDPTKWYPLVVPPMVMWGVENSSAASTINGFLWDAIVLNKGYARGTLLELDGHTWEAFTDGNSTNAFERAGTLFFIVSPETEFCE